MFKKILCSVDGSPHSKKALGMAAELARKYGASLTLMHVAPMPVLQLLAYRPPMGASDILPQQVEERLKEEGDAILQDAKTGAGSGLTLDTYLELGHPGECICEKAEAEDYDLVVMGSRGMGRLQGILMGGVSSYVLAHCDVPVLVVKDPKPEGQG